MEKFAQNIISLPILALAFVGDSVFDVYVRSGLALNSPSKVKDMHKRAVSIVNARAQAEFFATIRDRLTEEEMAIFNRGKNAKVSVPASANAKDYSIATGFEAVLGGLYLSGGNERITELLSGLFR